MVKTRREQKAQETKESRKERQEAKQAVDSLLTAENHEEEEASEVYAQPEAARLPNARRQRNTTVSYRGPQFCYPLRNKSAPPKPERFIHEKGWRDILKLNRKYAMTKASRDSHSDCIDPSKISLAEIGKDSESGTVKERKTESLKRSQPLMLSVPIKKKVRKDRIRPKPMVKESPWKSISKEELDSIFDKVKVMKISEQEKGGLFKRSVEDALGINTLDDSFKRPQNMKDVYSKIRADAMNLTKKRFPGWRNRAIDLVRPFWDTIVFEREGEAGLLRFDGLAKHFSSFQLNENQTPGAGGGRALRRPHYPAAYYTDAVEQLSSIPRDFGKEVEAGFVKHRPGNAASGKSLPSFAKNTPMKKRGMEGVCIFGPKTNTSPPEQEILEEREEMEDMSFDLSLLDMSPGDDGKGAVEQSEGLDHVYATQPAGPSGNLDNTKNTNTVVTPILNTSNQRAIHNGCIFGPEVIGGEDPVRPLDRVQPPDPVADPVDEHQLFLAMLQSYLAAGERPFNEADRSLDGEMAELRMKSIKKATDQLVKEMVGDDKEKAKIVPFYEDFFAGLTHPPDEETALGIIRMKISHSFNKAKELRESCEKYASAVEKAELQRKENEKNKEERAKASIVEKVMKTRNEKDKKVEKKDGRGEKEEKRDECPGGGDE